MLKALIVDDEMIVRKGLIAFIPWERHGIMVVGDVSSGEKAIEFIGENQIDLLITDISMPGMSGLELMHNLRDAGLDIWFVVLSFHNEFEYIQDALRLGAIDYILKTQIDDTHIDLTLDRILARIQSNQRISRPVPQACSQSGGHLTGKIDLVLALTALDHPVDPIMSDSRLIEFIQKHLYEIDSRLWIFCQDGQACPNEQDPDLRSFLQQSHWVQIIVTGIQGIGLNIIYNLLREFKRNDLFYEHASGKMQYVVSCQELINRKRDMPGEIIKNLREQWAAVYWIYVDDDFKKLLGLTNELRPPVQKLESILYSAVAMLEKNFPHIINAQLFQETERFIAWGDWEKWLAGIRQRIRQTILKKKYSEEIISSIMKSLDYIDSRDFLGISEEDVARKVNLSRSYFSHCFHDIIGKPFGDYLKTVRMSKAELLLVHTKLPIYQIADQLGYQNEKYFSRIFFRQFGILPSKYRNEISRS